MNDHILVAIDGSMSSVRQLEIAARHARAVGARLTIVHPFADREGARSALPVSRTGTSAQEAASARVIAAGRHARSVGGEELEVDVRAERGSAAVVVARLLEELGPDVLVMGNLARRRALPAGTSAGRGARRVVVAVSGLRGLEPRGRGRRRLAT